jgi:hypothetical protein
MPTVSTITATDTDRVAIDHVANSVEDLDAVRAHLRALKEEETQLLAVIREAIGDSHVGTIDGVDAIRLDERTNTSVDKSAVKALLSDELYASVLRLTPYTTVNVVGRFRSASVK